ncbi:MAG: NUDIX hydrolase, partial [Pseudomonadota bacterium]|nr:NUDIX hydrolase [Pseudomonadota bacterium]
AQVGEILERTQATRLAPDLSHLSAGEREAAARLLEVGAIFQRIYEDQRHRSALAARAALERSDDPQARDLLTLYRLFQGPIATTLDNGREPFLAVEPAPPGKNVYPWDLTREEFDALLAAHPERRPELMHLRSVVRRADAASLARDLEALRRHPVLDALHPGLRPRLEALARRPDRTMLYAAPYSVAYADETIRAYGLLNEAAAAVEESDPEFAGYLRNRARDILSDDYEAGDAAWITGRFGKLNAQIGAYETYDDELLGTRAFYSLSLLARRGEESEALRQGMQGLQAIEDALPYDRQKRVREDIPVGVYDVIADFGQSRGGNTASILPNEPLTARRYGRTILLRANIMRAPEIFGAAGNRWRAAVAPQFADHLTADSNFHRTLWHEVGHYLGVDRTRDGCNLDEALGADSNLLEEMKADLVSLFAGRELRRRGYFDEAQLRSHYASGISRTLQNNRPRRDQPYQTMQLMQFNWFLDRGVLRFDPATGRLAIDYGRYHEAVEALLREVLTLQDAGDPRRSDAFVDRWTEWDDALHGRIAASIRAEERYRYRLFTYAALGE